MFLVSTPRVFDLRSSNAPRAASSLRVARRAKPPTSCPRSLQTLSKTRMSSLENLVLTCSVKRLFLSRSSRLIMGFRVDRRDSGRMNGAVRSRLCSVFSPTLPNSPRFGEKEHQSKRDTFGLVTRVTETTQTPSDPPQASTSDLVCDACGAKSMSTDPSERCQFIQLLKWSFSGSWMSWISRTSLNSTASRQLSRRCRQKQERVAEFRLISPLGGLDE